MRSFGNALPNWRTIGILAIVSFAIIFGCYRICHSEKTETELFLDIWTGEIFAWLIK